jgi:hypothetical protein
VVVIACELGESTARLMAAAVPNPHFTAVCTTGVTCATAASVWLIAWLRALVVDGQTGTQLLSAARCALPLASTAAVSLFCATPGAQGSPVQCEALSSPFANATGWKATQVAQRRRAAVLQEVARDPPQRRRRVRRRELQFYAEKDARLLGLDAKALKLAVRNFPPLFATQRSLLRRVCNWFERVDGWSRARTRMRSPARSPFSASLCLLCSCRHAVSLALATRSALARAAPHERSRSKRQGIAATRVASNSLPAAAACNSKSFVPQKNFAFLS